MFLPQFLDLKVKNMTTFPQDLHISFNRGINVVFGGNYSGKTTIMNAIRFGVFGLSWGHTIEGIERRYFFSRIREVGRKSLDISALYKINPMTVDVRRTVFSSGTAEIEAQVAKGSTSSFSKSVDIIKSEKQYYSLLRECMGHINEEQLRFIPDLIFAEENRQCILWMDNLEDFVLNLLISQKSANQLGRIGSQLAKTRDEMKRLQGEKEHIDRRISEREAIQKFLTRSLKEYEETKTEKYVQEYKKVELELQELRGRLAQVDAEIQLKLKGKADLAMKLNATREDIDQLKLKSEKVQEHFLRALLNPKNPEESHVSRYLYYNKQCPFCLTSLSEEIAHRMESKVCLFCGKGSLTEYKGDLKEIKHEISDLDKKKEKLALSSIEIEADLGKIDREIVTLTKSRAQENVQDDALTARMNEFKGIGEKMHKKEVISVELEEIQVDINRNKKLMVENETNAKKVEAEIHELEKTCENGKTVMRSEVDLALNKIKTNFSAFVSLATNNEASGSLSTNLIPVLNGRRIFHPEFSSQFERAMMDYAFRIAILSVIAENTKSCPSLVIETPDEVTDESYIPHLAKALLSFSPNLSIIITTVDMEMMKQLLVNYKPEDRTKRLVNLVSKGTLTQRSFYQTPLIDYLSENS